MMVRLLSDIVNTKGSVLPVCDKPYHTNKRKVRKGEEIEVFRNCALLSNSRLFTLHNGLPIDPLHCILMVLCVI